MTAPMFDGFGDESCGAEFICYAIVILEEGNVASVEKVLEEIKIEAGVDSQDPLQCRELFSHAARCEGPLVEVNREGCISAIPKTIRANIGD
jgi:hypothetical protein